MLYIFLVILREGVTLASFKDCRKMEDLIALEGIGEREYNGKMIRKPILRVQEHSRKDLLEREETELSGPKLVFNITY